MKPLPLAILNTAGTLIWTAFAVHAPMPWNILLILLVILCAGTAVYNWARVLRPNW